MNRFRSLITVAAFSLAVLCLPAIASAQYGNGGYGGYGGDGNGGYGNNGRYGNSGYGDMRSVIRDLKNKAGDFQRQLDRDLDHSRVNGTYREDQINQLARDFRNAVNRLDGNGRNNDYRMQEVFNLASQIDRSVGRIGGYSQGIWQGIRYDLQQLGQYNGGGYNNGRGNRRNNGSWGNGNRNGLPSWWPF
jgi:hypothetical protein